MENGVKKSYKDYERIIVAGISILTGFIVAYISIIGPLFLNIIAYKSSESGVFQFTGQDLVNLVFVAPMLIVGGGFLFFKKPIGISMLTFLPLYLIYYGLSYAIGLEWSNQTLFGNSEHNIHLYIGILVNSLIILLYCIENLDRREMIFKKRGLIVYSILATMLTLMFAASYIQVIQQNLVEPTEVYLAAPALFWFVKTFDLSFLVPLMGISIYLLWTRPLKSYLIQHLNFGFFITMTSAVNAMALIMWLKGDPTYSLPAHVLFMTLELISIVGFVYILRSTKSK